MEATSPVPNSSSIEDLSSHRFSEDPGESLPGISEESWPTSSTPQIPVSPSESAVTAPSQASISRSSSPESERSTSTPAPRRTIELDDTPGPRLTAELETPEPRRTADLETPEPRLTADTEDSTPVVKSKGVRVDLEADEYTNMIRWCVSNQARLRQKSCTKGQFFQELRIHVYSTTGKDVKNSNRVVNRLVLKRRVEVEASKKKSGVALAETDLEQALDQWIETLDDMEALKAENQETEASKQIQQKELAKQHQADMMERRAKRQRLLSETPSPRIEQADSGSNSGDSSSSGGVTTTSKKDAASQQRLREVTLLNEGIKTALGSFGKDMKEAVTTLASASAERQQNELRKDVQSNFERMEQRMEQQMDSKMGEILGILRGMRGEKG